MNEKLSEFGEECRETRENHEGEVLAGGVGADGLTPADGQSGRLGDELGHH